MKLRTILLVLTAVACGIWDACMTSWFPSPLNAMRLCVPFAVILAAFSSSRAHALAIACLGGMVFDALVPSNAGYLTIRLACISLTIWLLTSRILTNRTLFSASAAAIVASVEDRALLALSEGLFTAMGRAPLHELRPWLPFSIVWNVVLVAGAFYLLASFGRRFLPSVSRIERSGRIPLWKS